LEELEDRCLLTGSGMTWIPLGPSPQLNPNGVLGTGGPPEATSGRVTALTFGTYHNLSALYAGTAGGGVWRSTDYNGPTPHWTPLTDNIGNAIDPTTGLGAGVIDTGALLASGSNLYDGTGEANAGVDSRYGTGILKSVNGGDAWTLVTGSTSRPTAFYPLSISKIIQDPAGNLYAAVVPPNLTIVNLRAPVANLGVYESINNGATWTLITSGAAGLPTGAVVTDLEYTGSGDNLKIYAGVGDVGDGDMIGGAVINGVYEGTLQMGGGFAWKLDPNLPSGANANIGRISLASDHNNVVYAALGTPKNNGNSPLYRVFGTSNNGMSWSNVTPPANLIVDGQSYYNLALGLSPITQRLYLGMQGNVFESNPGATTWRAITVGPDGVAPLADSHAFAFAPTGTAPAGAVYLGDDGGVWQLTPMPFDPPTTVNAGTTPTAMAVGDFNGDGIPDLIAVGGLGVGTISILTGNRNPTTGKGDGTYGNPITIQDLSASAPNAVVVGDFNGDGFLDFAVGHFGAGGNPGTVDVYLNKGQAGGTTFNNPVTYTVGRGAETLAVGNFTGRANGKRIDLVTANALDNSVSVLINNGNGTFQNAVAVSVPKQGVAAAAVGDFNGDGWDDIAVATTSPSGSVLILLNRKNANGTSFLPSSNIAVGASPTAIAVGDFKGDGRGVDIATANLLDNSVSVLLNQRNGSGTFNNAVSYAVGKKPDAITTGDFNGDGKLDLAVADHDSGDVSVLLNKADGSGAFFPALAYSLPWQGTGPAPASYVVAADINGDNKTDLAVSSADGTSTSVYAFLSNGNAPQAGNGAWVDLNTTGLNTLQLYSASLSPYNNGSTITALEGSQDNSVALTTNAYTNPPYATWNMVEDQNQTFIGDGGTVRFDPADTSGNTAYGEVQYGAIFKTTDRGATWNPIQTGLNGVGDPQDFPGFAKFEIDPSNSQRLIIGAINQVYETRNGGGNWGQLPALPGDQTGVTALAYAPSHDDTIYVGFNDGKVFRTDNDGAAWTAVPLPVAPAPVTSIVVDPGNKNKVYASVGGPGIGVYWDSQGGAGGWLSIANNLPAVPVNALLLSTSLSGAQTLYAGTDIGVYDGTNPAGLGWSWGVYGSGLPIVQVDDLQLQTIGTTTWLAAATHGRGLWVIDPPGPATGGDKHLGERQAGSAETSPAPTSAPPAVPSPAAAPLSARPAPASLLTALLASHEPAASAVSDAVGEHAPADSVRQTVLDAVFSSGFKPRAAFDPLNAFAHHGSSAPDNPSPFDSLPDSRLDLRLFA
jgi:hypothetical protein